MLRSGTQTIWFLCGKNFLRYLILKFEVISPPPRKLGGQKSKFFKLAENEIQTINNFLISPLRNWKKNWFFIRKSEKIPNLKFSMHFYYVCPSKINTHAKRNKGFEMQNFINPKVAYFLYNTQLEERWQ